MGAQKNIEPSPPSMASYAVGPTGIVANNTPPSMASYALQSSQPTPTINSFEPTPTIPTINSFDYSAVDEVLARARQQATQRYVPSIEDLFPQLAQSQYLQGEQTASAPVSSGAGRFMGTTK